MKLSRKLFYWIISIGVFVSVFLLFSWYHVEGVAKGKIIDIDNIPLGYETILLLGTSPKLRDGRGNLFYIYRIDAVEELIKSGKVNHILVSGDNGTKEYNEPHAMQDSLIERGIDEEIIELDYAGFRTLDSVVRAGTVFDAAPMVIISQQFHIERALTIADAWGIDAVGYSAQAVSLDIAPRVYLREILARGKMVFDLYVLHTQPKFIK